MSKPMQSEALKANALPPVLDINYEPVNISDGLPEFDELIDEIRIIVRELWTQTEPPGLDRITGYTSILNQRQMPTPLFVYKDLDNEAILHITKENSIGPNFNEKKPLMDIVTDFNTVNFFSTKETRTNFIYVANSVLTTMVDEMQRYLSDEIGKNDCIGVMFKGGTTMRVLVKELVRNFTAEVENYVNEMIKNSVKLSDYDFEIVTQFGVPERIIVKINAISYLCLLKLRNYLETHRTFYFDFFKLTPEVQRWKLRELKVKLQQKADEQEDYFLQTIDYIEFDGSCINAADKLFDVQGIPHDLKQYKYILQMQPEESVSTCRTDFAIIVDLAHKLQDVGVISTHKLLSEFYHLDERFYSMAKTSRQTGSHFYVTHNPTIEWGKHDQTTHFALNRIKYNYTVYFTDRQGDKFMIDIPGEILDLSHAHGNDRKKVMYSKEISKLRFLERFKFVNNDLEYLSYSLHGHIKDIGGILFPETGYQPWEDQKYGKRIQRIIIIATLLYFNQEGLGSYYDKIRSIANTIEAIESNRMIPEDQAHNVVEQLSHNIVRCYHVGMERYGQLQPGDEKDILMHNIHEFKQTCIATMTKMHQALQAQEYYTRNQSLTYSHNTKGQATGLTTLPLNLDYPNIY
jgi:hypothetical protein